ncbi:MAG TPA: PQ-loop repeat-containing protein [Thermoanaerobaculia bacterium]|nr:PQ-loop repeat-containing protein [Thermoanaerobaculia bacterium]
MGQVSQVLGFLGAVTVAIGYLPQIRHLARERCSAGVSVVAWEIWLLSSFLVFSHAFEMLDLVFITLQTVQIAAIILIISLARRYRGMTCAFHRLLANQPAGSAIGD